MCAVYTAKLAQKYKSETNETTKTKSNIFSAATIWLLLLIEELEMNADCKADKTNTD